MTLHLYVGDHVLGIFLDLTSQLVMILHFLYHRFDILVYCLWNTILQYVY